MSHIPFVRDSQLFNFVHISRIEPKDENYDPVKITICFYCCQASCAICVPKTPTSIAINTQRVHFFFAFPLV